ALRQQFRRFPWSDCWPHHPSSVKATEDSIRWIALPSRPSEPSARMRMDLGWPLSALQPTATSRVGMTAFERLLACVLFAILSSGVGVILSESHGANAPIDDAAGGPKARFLLSVCGLYALMFGLGRFHLARGRWRHWYCSPLPLWPRMQLGRVIIPGHDVVW